MNPSHNTFQTMSTRRKRLIFAAAGAFGASLLLPGVGPLTRHELSVAAQNAADFSPPIYAADRDAIWAQSEQQRIAHLPLDRAAAAKMPDDFGVQLALCERETPFNKSTLFDEGEPDAPAGQIGRREKVARKLLALSPRFLDKPAFYAAVLRNLAADAVSLQNCHGGDTLRDESEAAQKARKNAPDPSAENLAAWHEAARTGAALEPQNAFFPLMQAIGLFAQGRSQEAHTALLRASTKTLYNDYSSDAITGAIRLNDAEGTQPGVSRLITHLNQTMPHHKAITNLGYLVTYQALGQNIPENDFKIRQTLRKIGTLIRVSSRTYPGAHEGQRLVEISALSPDGLDKTKGAYEIADTAVYEANLRKSGYTEEAQAIAFERQESAANKHLFKAVQNNPAFYLNLPRLLRLVLLPLTLLVLLGNALVLLIAGGLCAFLVKTRPIQGGKGLSPAALNGAASVVFVPLWVGIAVMCSPVLSALTALFCGAVLGGVGFACRRPATGAATGAASHDAGKYKPARFVRHWLGGLIGTGFALTALVGLGMVLGRAAVGPVAEMGMHDTGLQAALGFFSVFIAPLLFLLFAACAPKAGVPVSVGMVRGMRGGGGPCSLHFSFACGSACGLVGI